MSATVRSCMVLLLGAVTSLVAASPAMVVPRDGTSPNLPFDPNTTSYCSWWVDLEGSITCSAFATENGITLDQFRRWNPSIPSNCGTLKSGFSYCVEAFSEPVPTTSTTKKITTATTTNKPTTPAKPPTTTTTKPTNGINTPLPTQTGMATNCNKFHLVPPGQTCATIATQYSISVAQFQQWNPAAKSDCTGLWANSYACVGIIGKPTTTTKPPATTTKKDNGISTPTPTQPGMVNNCKKFALVKSGDTCAVLATKYNITLDQFNKWNTGVGGKDCKSLWANVYVCIGV
ncbi:hypothetical protein V8F20_006074 [Naviculisporaceae sp. PSN 640]